MSVFHTAESGADSVCADGATLAGISVNQYSGTINWASVVADGIDFAYIRVANGLTQDPSFVTNWTGSNNASLIRGAFQVLQPDLDALQQAQVMVQAIGALAPGDLPPALAVEVIGGQNPTVIAAKVGTWLNYVEASLGLKPVIYTGRYFWQDSVGSSDYADHPLWIADYSSPTCPNLPIQWADWVLWEDSTTGSVEGITGDASTVVFNGDSSALAAFGVPPLCDGQPCPLFENGFEDIAQSADTSNLNLNGFRPE